MAWKERAAKLLKKYQHGWVFAYLLIYLPWFYYLERHVTKNYHVIHAAIDDKIPFIEFFIVPYFLWFVFIAAVFLYFFFADVPGFYKLAKLMFIGMTIFLVVSTLMPNGLHLRPYVFERDNIFVDMVRLLYRVDTPTNVMPSLHVYNSLAACIAIYQSRKLQKHKAVCAGSYILTALIILATMFLKQHSAIDVTAAFIMSYLMYQFVYEPEKVRYPQRTVKTAFASK